MNITLEIQNNGLSKGSLGWLCSNLGKIKIGNTKTGNQAAWLLDRDEKNITVLAVRGWWEGTSSIEKAGRNADYCHYYAPTLDSNMVFTDAAWEIVKQCQDIAVEEMEESVDKAVGINISSVKKELT